MTSITSIPSSRVSNLSSSQRLLAQIQNAQLGLQQLETQISSGKRIVLPSDDPAATEQAVGLNRLIDQKMQIKNNIDTSQSYLTQTDTALANVSNLLSSARSTALSVIGTTADASQRQTAAQVISGAIQQLSDIGNQNFNGRYLFAGSQAGLAPFRADGANVKYSGNDTALSSLSDLSQLFQSNVTGAAAFGALSAGIGGTVSLTPAVTASTKLSDLNGGRGVSPGSIKISDGVSTTVVDLSHAVTVGDVAASIVAHPPQGRTARADITPTGLSISLDAAGGGNLSITQDGNASTAADLGILNSTHIGPGPIVGQPQNPLLTLTTPLGNVIGARAEVFVPSPGTSTNIVLQAKRNGAAYNGYTVNLIDDHTVAVGHETVSYDTVGKSITVDVAGGLTTAKNVVDAIDNSPAAADFTAALDPSQFKNDGSGAVALSSATTAGGGGALLDQAAGLQITNGGQTYTIDISHAQTVEDLLNSLNGSQASVLAEINPTGTGIDVHSRLSGSDFAIGENGGVTATQLGLRTLTGASQLSDLNHGAGVPTASSGADFLIQRKDGYQLRVRLSGAKTVQDAIDKINNDPNNQIAASKVTAQLAASGNGIVLTTTDTSSVSPFAVIEQNGSTAAESLGLVPAGRTQSNPSTASAGAETIAGKDVNPQETTSAFNALIRLKTALQSNDTAGITRAVGLIDSSSNQLNLTRAELGAREESLTAISTSLANEQNNLQSSLSSTVDTDIAAAITQLTALQTSFTATLQLTAALSKLTLLNYL